MLEAFSTTPDKSMSLISRAWSWLRTYFDERLWDHLNSYSYITYLERESGTLTLRCSMPQRGRKDELAKAT